MKEHFQDSGVRKWAGDDLIELQSESLDALQGLVEPYAPCIIKGCEVETIPGVDGAEPTYKVSGGLVALRGVDAAGNGCVKIARVEGFASEVMPVFLSLANKQTTRAYGDGSSKVIANDYIAECSVIASEGALELTDAGGERLVDMLGVTRKLDRDGGEAKDTMVGFTEATTRTELTTGSKLGVLFGLVKKWFSDLRALAFKDKVAKGDLTDGLAGELNSKVDKVSGMGLSSNDFTDALKDKLNTFDHAAGGDLAGRYPNPRIKGSVNLSGSPTTTTQAATDNSTKVATTAHVKQVLANENYAKRNSDNVLTAHSNEFNYTADNTNQVHVNYRRGAGATDKGVIDEVLFHDASGNGSAFASLRAKSYIGPRAGVGLTFPINRGITMKVPTYQTGGIFTVEDVDGEEVFTVGDQGPTAGYVGVWARNTLRFNKAQAAAGTWVNLEAGPEPSDDIAGETLINRGWADKNYVAKRQIIGAVIQIASSGDIAFLKKSDVFTGVRRGSGVNGYYWLNLSTNIDVSDYIFVACRGGNTGGFSSNTNAPEQFKCDPFVGSQTINSVGVVFKDLVSGVLSDTITVVGFAL